MVLATPVGRIKMLLVEDSKSTSKLYQRILRGAFNQFRLDVDIHIAMDGTEAVNLVKEGNRYHLITMDIEMKNVNGIDTAKIMKMMKVRRKEKRGEERRGEARR